MNITEHIQPQTASESTMFPAHFLWGAAASAYQIEGAAFEDGRGLSIWDQFASIPGKISRGESGEVAADHYHRMQEDVDLMAELGLNAYRFSISWPRILPQGRGAVNPRGLDFYDRLVDALLARGILPCVTLYHWDLPLALHEQGGWLQRDIAFAFADYAEVVARRLSDRVGWWITHNEPWCTAYLGYGRGVHAPGVQDVQASVVAAHHVLLSHGLALPRLRANLRPEARVGITLNFTPIYAADGRPETARVVRRLDAFNNRWFLDPIYRGSYDPEVFAFLGAAPPPMVDGDLALISTPIDFLGVNYYSRSLVRARPDAQASDDVNAIIEHVPTSDALYTEMQWEVYPYGLTDLLQRLHRDYAPRAMLITENGAAFEDHWNGDDSVHDPQRLAYIDQHIQATGRALADGVPIRGYFVWSLLDNFEWTEGFSKRFGLVYVDYATQLRIIKDSGRWYAAFIASHKQEY